MRRPLEVKCRCSIIFLMGPIEWWNCKRCSVNLDLGLPLVYSLKCSLNLVKKDRPAV